MFDLILRLVYILVVMGVQETNPPYRNGNSAFDIKLSTHGEPLVIKDRTFVQTEGEFLPLCKMCKKSPMTCDNDLIRLIEMPMISGDAPELEIRGTRKLPSGEMSEEMGLGFKLVDGVKAGIYKTTEDMPEPIICKLFDPKDLG